MLDVFTCRNCWDERQTRIDGDRHAVKVNQSGGKVVKRQYHPSDHEDATTVLIRSHGRPYFTDDLDALITTMKETMVEGGTDAYRDSILISEERAVSIEEIEQEFLAEDWSD